jgi:hypothetical protein
MCFLKCSIICCWNVYKRLRHHQIVYTNWYTQLHVQRLDTAFASATSMNCHVFEWSITQRMTAYVWKLLDYWHLTRAPRSDFLHSRTCHCHVTNAKGWAAELRDNTIPAHTLVGLTECCLAVLTNPLQFLHAYLIAAHCHAVSTAKTKDWRCVPVPVRHTQSQVRSWHTACDIASLRVCTYVLIATWIHSMVWW